MTTFRQLLLSIAGLGLLCWVQSHAQPHRQWVDYSSKSPATQTLRATPAPSSVGLGAISFIRGGSHLPELALLGQNTLPDFVVAFHYYERFRARKRNPRFIVFFPLA